MKLCGVSDRVDETYLVSVIQVEQMGGLQQVQRQPLEPISHPSESQPSLLEFGRSLAAAQQERAATAAPVRVAGDAVETFGELAAARGALGRFTGAGVMPLVRQFQRQRTSAAA